MSSVTHGWSLRCGTRMRTSTPSRAAPISASTSDQLGTKYALAIQIERSAEIACIWSARAMRRRSGSPSTMPTSAGSAVAGSRCAPRATRRVSRCEPRRSLLLRALPHRVERLLHVARGGALDAHGGVAPVAAMALPSCRIHSSPMPTPPVMPTARVDDEQLAVIARHEAEPGAEARRVEHADARRPRCAQAGDEAASVMPRMPIQSVSSRTLHAALHRVDRARRRSAGPISSERKM